ncbi:Serine hydroxymethyltransferase 7 [Camellia lanceoleosa]|uniref:Serine hydroxymethyltransferase 7 n=1 Tax=Camellia lanceoleosa TaxID=1840588 RepID=A0ACC0FZF3_9ERIC|nr:Serine hydroxymethyltransferase 7 [Camellia lanceoleosa]
MDTSDPQMCLRIGCNRNDDSELVPLQLTDQHQKHENDIEEGESRNDEKFRIMGHSMFLKRMRVGESVASCSSSSKRVSIERFKPHGLESRWSAVRAWGYQPLCVADPHVFWIMEKEKQRQM